MHFIYCPRCGTKTKKRQIGDEGLIPYCESCKTPLFDLFATSVICAVINEENEIALLLQNYVSTENHVCVAGIMKPGERAEDAAAREIYEELGLSVQALRYVESYPYEKKGMLMLGFRADVRKQDFILSGEVDAAEWVLLNDAPKMLRKGGIAWQLVRRIIRETERGNG